MALIDDLTTIRDNLIAEVKAETALRVAGGRGRPNYTANGRTVDWNGWLAAMMKAIADLTAQINALDPYEYETHGYL